jgi:RimJ/RimL family protein N-acetyltransferase
MIRPIYGFDDVVANFVARSIFPNGGDFGNKKAIGFAKDGELVAGFVYHNWNPDAEIIEVSGASLVRNWATKAVVQVIFGYPFDQIGCQSVFARHSEHNKRVRRIWRALGAQEYVIPRLRGRDEAEAVALLTVEAWRSSKFAEGE